MPPKRAFLSFSLTLLALVLVCCLQAGAAEAANRVALIIGNDSYSKQPKLANARNDARDLAAVLSRDLGFEIVGGGPQLDKSRGEMLDLLETFANRLRPDDIALFYFAGHGVAESGTNWLIPVNDQSINYVEDVTERAISQRSVISRLEARGASGMNVIILDACRNNPLPSRVGGRSVGSRGLARLPAPFGTFIAYAADEGQTASDRGGRNGLFTGELLQRITKPGLRIDDLFREVGNAVYEHSGRTQSPAIEDKLRHGTFYFKQGPSPAAPQPAPTPVAPSFDPQAAERAYWSVVDRANTDSLLAYLGRYPSGQHAQEAKDLLAALMRPKPQDQGPNLVGSWQLNWTGANATYTGTLKIHQRVSANEYEGTLDLRWGGGEQVQQGAKVRVSGDKVTVNCHSPTRSTWSPDNFYLTLNGSKMSGHSVDGEGRRGSQIDLWR